MAAVNRTSLLISTATILFVLISSLMVMIFFMARDLDSTMSATADEMSSVLVVPLYNIDDDQTRRILETMASSGRISGIFLESTMSGVLMDKKPPRTYPLIRTQVREIEYRGIKLGRLELYPSASLLVNVGGGIILTMLAVIVAVVVANVLANRKLVQNRVQGVLGSIIAGLSEISRGNYRQPLSRSGYEDMDSIVRVVNEMSESIRAKSEQLTEVNLRLEERVAERTKELESALRDQALLQERLIESGKLTALGQLSAGIAHELNTPLGAIQSSARTLTDFFERSLPGYVGAARGFGPAEGRLLDALVEAGLAENRDLSGPLPEHGTARRIAAALESAGFRAADEIAASLAEMRLSGSMDRIIPLLGTGRDAEVVQAAAEMVVARRMTEVINESTRKGAAVVSAIRSYLSPQIETEGGVIDLPEEISRVLTLMHNMLKHGSSVRTRFSPIKVKGSSDRLSQVWMNIIRNAAQAMDFRGELEITVEREDGLALVSFADSGPGIPPEIQGSIFKPFFTTKKHGDGLGLGLDICKKIVEAHEGAIRFESRPGRTVFNVSLPALPPA